MIPAHYREKLPPYWYENEVAEYHFEGAGGESAFQSEKIAELGKQFLLPYATYSLDVWDWLFFGETKLGTKEERREAIRRKNLAKSRFTLQTLYSIGRAAGNLLEISEDFARKEITFQFSDSQPVKLLTLTRDFERIRPVHVIGSQSVVRSIPEAVVVGGLIRCHTIDYLLCGTFYPEDDLEGRIYRESVAIADVARSHTINYPLANMFYSQQEV